MYTIGQVSEMFNIPASTLRYYDNEGLFRHMQRTSGIRKFSDLCLESLRVIECLKKSGLEIKDIKQFMQWCAQGPSTYKKRKALFDKQEAAVLAEISKLNKTLATLKFKQWYYEKAIETGSEKYAQSLLPNKLPKEIQKYFDIAHEL